MTHQVKVSSTNHIAVPSAIRKQLEIKPGVMDVRDGIITVLPEPKDLVAATRGLYRDVWEGIDPEAYVRGERGLRISTGPTCDK